MASEPEADGEEWAGLLSSDGEARMDTAAAEADLSDKPSSADGAVAQHAPGRRKSGRFLPQDQEGQEIPEEAEGGGPGDPPAVGGKRHTGKKTPTASSANQAIVPGGRVGIGGRRMRADGQTDPLDDPDRDGSGDPPLFDGKRQPKDEEVASSANQAIVPGGFAGSGAVRMRRGEAPPASDAGRSGDLPLAGSRRRPEDEDLPASTANEAVLPGGLADAGNTRLRRFGRERAHEEDSGPLGDPPSGGRRTTRETNRRGRTSLPLVPEGASHRWGREPDGVAEDDGPPQGPDLADTRRGRSSHEDRGSGKSTLPAELGREPARVQRLQRDAEDAHAEDASLNDTLTVRGQRMRRGAEETEAGDQPGTTLPAELGLGGPRLRSGAAESADAAAEGGTLQDTLDVRGPRLHRGSGEADAPELRPVGDPTVGGIRLAEGSGALPAPVDSDEPGPLPAVSGPRMRRTYGDPVPASRADNGLDAALRFPPRLRGLEPPVYEDEPVDEGPPSLPIEALDAMLAPGQETSEAGERRERISERTFDRLDFRWQRYLVLRVTRALYRCPVRPDLEPIVARWPAFVTETQPFGNGLVARLVEEHFYDGTLLPEIARTQSQVSAFVRAGRLAEALRHADEVLAPVYEALVEDVAAGTRKVDRSGVRTLCLDGRKVLDARVVGLRAECGRLLLVEGSDEATRLSEGAHRTKRLAEGVVRRLQGRSRAGRWGTQRKRLALALPRHPVAAARGLHLAWLVERLAQQDDATRLHEAQRAFSSWVDHHAGQEPSSLQRAAAFGAAHRDTLALVGPRGDRLDEAPPGPRDPTVVWRMTAEVSRTGSLRLASLVETCAGLGLRPWQWLAEALDASAHGRLQTPADWTPARWAARVGAGARC